MDRVITVDDLERWGACETDTNVLLGRWPDGMPVNDANVAILMDHNVDVTFGALHLLHEREGFGAVQEVVIAICRALVEQMLVALPALTQDNALCLAAEFSALRSAFDTGLLANIGPPASYLHQQLPPYRWFVRQGGDGADDWKDVILWIRNVGRSHAAPLTTINAVSAVMHYADNAITGWDRTDGRYRPTQTAWGHLLATRLGLREG